MEPKRIVSLVPSLTELVWWLGRGESLVGRTRFCTEPAGAIEGVAVIGGTKNPKVERIVELAPDLVIANREENRKEDVEAVQAAGLEVLLTDPNSVPGAVAMVRELGVRLAAEAKAEELARETESALDEQTAGPGRRVFVAIWKEPLMGLGSGTYGNDLLERCGGVNVLGDRARYPEVSLEELRGLGTELVLLPDEPYPFKASDAEAFASVAPARVVDGKLLWWYGPRMPAAIRELRAVLRG